MLTLEVRSQAGKSTRHAFDATVDRRIIIGRASSCDLVLTESGASRKHAMLICADAGWLLTDLGSTNGVELNGARVTASHPVEPGDVVRIGATEIRLLTLGALPEPYAARKLEVELDEGFAKLGDETLPLSAAELIWFAWLASNRAGGEGWVTAGRDGHAAFGAFTATLLTRAWAASLRSAPLVQLARGHDVDDEDLKNLRGKTAQKLRAFCVGKRAWLAALVVPEVKGKNQQRLPLATAAVVVRGR